MILAVFDPWLCIKQQFYLLTLTMDTLWLLIDPWPCGTLCMCPLRLLDKRPCVSFCYRVNNSTSTDRWRMAVSYSYVDVTWPRGVALFPVQHGGRMSCSELVRRQVVVRRQLNVRRRRRRGETARRRVSTGTMSTRRRSSASLDCVTLHSTLQFAVFDAAVDLCGEW